METMKNKIDLSDYAHVTILLNLYDGQSGVSITKKPYGKSMNDVAYLDLDEWKELSKNMLEIKRAAREMRERVDANELSDIPTPMYPCDVTKILSTKYLAKLNRFEAPTKQTYITLAIRPFTLDKGKEPRPNSKEGVTLNQAELSALADQVFVIQNIIAEQMTSTRFIHLVTQEDVEREKKKMDLFFQMASGGQKCRIILEKKDRQWLTPSADAVDAPNFNTSTISGINASPPHVARSTFMSPAPDIGVVTHSPGGHALTHAAQGVHNLTPGAHSMPRTPMSSAHSALHTSGPSALHTSAAHLAVHAPTSDTYATRPKSLHPFAVRPMSLPSNDMVGANDATPRSLPIPNMPRNKETCSCGDVCTCE